MIICLRFSQDMATTIVAASQSVHDLASALPVLEFDEKAQLVRISHLQEDNYTVSKELEVQLAISEKHLVKLNSLFEATTDELLLS